MDPTTTAPVSVEIFKDPDDISSSTLVMDNGDYDLCGEELVLDVSGGDGSEDRLELDREWNRRQNQFHTIGYRDGLMAGKEATAQEGFNAGFKEAVMAGYKWGLARGITSSSHFLPVGLKDKLIGSPQKTSELEKLYESIGSVSSTEAVGLFHSDLLDKKSPDPSVNSLNCVEQGKVGYGGGSSEVSGQVNSSVEASHSNKLGTFTENLRLALCECSAHEMVAILDSPNELQLC